MLSAAATKVAVEPKLLYLLSTLGMTMTSADAPKTPFFPHAAQVK